MLVDQHVGVLVRNRDRDPLAVEEEAVLLAVARTGLDADAIRAAHGDLPRAPELEQTPRGLRDVPTQLGFQTEAPLPGEKVRRAFERGEGVRQDLRPDRARVEARSRDGEQNSLFFDGKRIAIAIPDENAYVLVDKPGSLDDAMDYLALELDTPVPLADIVQSDFYAEISERIVAGIDLGDSRVDGVDCQHLAFDAGEVDFQIWIEDGDRPLPRRLVITYKNEPGNPQFWARLHGWKLGAKVPDAVFAFQPAAGAERIPFSAASREIAQERGGR